MNLRLCVPLLLVGVLSAEPPSAIAQASGRTKTRVLYSFEEDGEVARLAKTAEHADLSVAQDVGVTAGRRCARLVAPKGSEYSQFKLEGAALRGWGDFDYFAVDVTTDDDHPYQLHLELWDARSTNYATRCTLDAPKLHSGLQTLLIPINRARRNGKEGRDWNELEAKDKIDLDKLTQVKIFFQPRPDRDAVLFLDNLRLLQEDAARPKMEVTLPAGALAFKFGSSGVKVPGFTTVAPHTKSGLADAADLTAAGDGWPDPLSGTFVQAREGAAIDFQTAVPNGNYRAWLWAGPIYRAQPHDRRFQLKLNDVVLADAEPSAEEYYSERYLYRFLNSQYSEKPHALWDTYIDHMYPTFTTKLTVANGKVNLHAVNHFVSALVLAPERSAADFDKFTDSVSAARRTMFERTLRPHTDKKPTPRRGEAFVCYEPDFGVDVRPSTGPSEAERGKKGLHAAAARGQHAVVRLAVTPFQDLGKCRLEPSELKGPASIPAARIDVRFANYRWDGENLGEMALLPSSTLNVESGVTQCFWLTIATPKDAAPGLYHGDFVFRTARAGAVAIPVEFEVYPFELEPVLPVSFGMYWDPPQQFGLSAGVQRRILEEQLLFMRQIGFTAIPVGSPTYAGLRPDGGVRLTFDSTLFDLARAAGMGRHPAQFQMATALGVARAIGRRLPGSEGPAVDRDPGLELRQPEFRPRFLDAMKQYRDFLSRQKLPTAVEVVDEPRETPNPWNRNLADTLTYADLLHQAGLTTFVTPMGDFNSGKDYTSLADHIDILSVHAYPGSAKLMERVRKNGKRLWFYNTGMDRFSWGFYCWRAGATGRWEWHFCRPEDQARGGYPGREWYNPFTGSHGLTSYAPPDYPGGLLYQSGFVEVSEGVADYAYLLTLEKAIAAAPADKRAEAAAARTFLTALTKAIPALPGAKGLLGPDEGALVGIGLDDEARLQTPRWRAAIAGHLKQLAP